MPDEAGAGGATKNGEVSAANVERLERKLRQVIAEKRKLQAKVESAPPGDGSGANSAALATLQGKYDRLQEKYEELEDQVPPAGAAVLTGDDAKSWAAFKALNLAPDDLKKKLDAGAEALEKNEVYERRKTLDDAADAAGYNRAVFTRLAEQDGLVVAEIKEEGEGEKKVKVPYLKKAAEKDAKPVKASEYATANWKPFEKSLSDGATGSNGASGTKVATKAGPTFPAQSSGQKAATGDDKNAVEQLIASKRKSGAYAF